MAMARAFAVVSVWCSVSLACVGCGEKPDARDAKSPATQAMREDTVVVEGLLTGEVVECAAVRSLSGDLYALEDLPPPFDEWRRFLDERFMIVGEEVEPGRCGRSKTLRVLDMGLVLPPVILPDLEHSNG